MDVNSARTRSPSLVQASAWTDCSIDVLAVGGNLPRVAVRVGTLGAVARMSQEGGTVIAVHIDRRAHWSRPEADGDSVRRRAGRVGPPHQQHDDGGTRWRSSMTLPPISGPASAVHGGARHEVQCARECGLLVGESERRGRKTFAPQVVAEAAAAIETGEAPDDRTVQVARSWIGAIQDSTSPDGGLHGSVERGHQGNGSRVAR